ncbi:MAG: hypothetical protein C4567_04475 [Deltaproteobacteria bacterium]|nr:MAG: hypothetical protein C4567_04475 [Deltaproteobacteria bacterium]
MTIIKLRLNKYGSNRNNKIIVLKTLRAILYLDLIDAKKLYDEMGEGTVIIEATNYQILYLKQSSLFTIDDAPNDL